MNPDSDHTAPHTVEAPTRLGEGTLATAVLMTIAFASGIFVERFEVRRVEGRFERRLEAATNALTTSRRNDVLCLAASAVSVGVLGDSTGFLKLRSQFEESLAHLPAFEAPALEKSLGSGNAAASHPESARLVPGAVVELAKHHAALGGLAGTPIRR